jgi:hypothetical protein
MNRAARFGVTCDCPSSRLMFLQFAGVGREQAERNSGNVAKPAVPMLELRRQGSLLPTP